MLIESALLLLFTCIVGILVTRLTERTFQVRRAIVETSANEYSEVVINLPVAPVIGKGQMQGIEIMDVVSSLQIPTIEAAQNNRIQMGLVKDPQTGVIDLRSNQNIWYRDIESQTIEVTAVGEVLGLHERVKFDSLEHDGGGRILGEQNIHLFIKGTGLPGASSAQVLLNCHLVRLDSEDVVAMLLGDDT